MSNLRNRILDRSVRSYHGRIAICLAAVVALASAGCSTPAPSRAASVSLPPTTEPVTVEIPPDSVTVPPELTSGVSVSSDMDLEAIVDEAPEGTTFVLLPGTHRGHRVEPKDGMTFIGLPGSVMNGSVVIDAFSAEGDRWRVDGIGDDNRNHGRCVDGYEGCSLTQDLFIDGVMLWQVTARDELEPGSWFRDGDSIWIADDPQNRRVELSTESYAFVGSADNVTIQGLTVQMYATPAQEGAIQAQEPGEGDRGERWLIDGVDVAYNHGAGIRAGDHTTIRNTHIHHNGQLGVTGAGGVGLVIEECEIAYNNTAGFDWEWEAGGVKVTRSADVRFSGNDVHHNEGPGLWADIDVVDTLYEDNHVFDNLGPGIFHEISGSATITRNVVERNGLEKSSWLWGAGILVAASGDVEVFANVVSDNGNGITGVQQDRGSGLHGERLLVDLFVHHNTIDLGTGKMGIVEDVGSDDVFTTRNNRFASNTYLGSVGHDYLWLGRRLDRDGWQAYGQDTEGSWVR